MDTLALIAQYAAFITTIIGAIIAVCKPVRNWIFKPIRRYKELKKRKYDMYVSVLDNQKQIKRIVKTLNSIDDRLNNAEKDNVCTLRNIITQIYYRYVNEDSIPVYEKENLTHLYKRYKADDGNSYVDKIYGELMDKETEV
jgi:hypothetical protein